MGGLARGALISGLIAVFLLPTVFKVFQHILFGRSVKSMKSKKLIALTAIVALAFLPLNANAAPTVSDYENVYVIQDSAGGIKKIISVDWLRVEGKSPFTILDPIKEHKLPRS